MSQRLCAMPRHWMARCGGGQGLFARSSPSTRRHRTWGTQSLPCSRTQAARLRPGHQPCRHARVPPGPQGIMYLAEGEPLCDVSWVIPTLRNFQTPGEQERSEPSRASGTTSKAGRGTRGSSPEPPYPTRLGAIDDGERIGGKGRKDSLTEANRTFGQEKA